MRGRPSQHSTDLPLLCDETETQAPHAGCPYAFSDLSGPAALYLFSLERNKAKFFIYFFFSTDRLKDAELGISCASNPSGRIRRMSRFKEWHHITFSNPIFMVDYPHCF